MSNRNCTRLPSSSKQPESAENIGDKITELAKDVGRVSVNDQGVETPKDKREPNDQTLRWSEINGAGLLNVSTADLMNLDPEAVGMLKEDIFNCIKSQLGVEFTEDDQQKWTDSFKDIFKTLTDPRSQTVENGDVSQASPLDITMGLNARVINLDKVCNSQQLDSIRNDVFNSLKNRIGSEIMEDYEENWNSFFNSIADIFNAQISAGSQFTDVNFGSDQMDSIREQIFEAMQTQMGIELPENAKEKWDAAYKAMLDMILSQKEN